MGPIFLNYYYSGARSDGEVSFLFTPRTTFRTLNCISIFKSKKRWTFLVISSQSLLIAHKYDTILSLLIHPFSCQFSNNKRISSPPVRGMDGKYGDKWIRIQNLLETRNYCYLSSPTTSSAPPNPNNIEYIQKRHKFQHEEHLRGDIYIHQHHIQWRSAKRGECERRETKARSSGLEWLRMKYKLPRHCSSSSSPDLICHWCCIQLLCCL